MKFIVILTLALLIHVSQTQYLAPHNAARVNVNVGRLVWNNNLAAYARDYANQRVGDCNLIHSGGPYGENIAMSTSYLSPAYAVNMWVSEISFYDYGSNSCQGGECGHYTQVVWRNSVRLGCASVTCDSGGTFVICNYDPPGNWRVQRPYQTYDAVPSDIGSIYNI